jgi:hypothetical protein
MGVVSNTADLTVADVHPRGDATGETDIVRLADLNLAEFMRHTARWGGAVSEEDGLLLVAGAHPNPGPYRNCAIRLENRLDAAEVRERLDSFFGSRRRSYVLWARDHADGDLIDMCEAAGMRLLEPDGLPELAMRHRPEQSPLPDGVRLVLVREDSERREFLKVNAEGWGLPEMDTQLAADTFFHPDSVVGPNVAAILTYVDGAPASASMALVSYGAVGGYWGATAPWARRRGLADLCVRAMFNAGFDLGARTAVCQASGSGEGIWRRMGFERITRYHRYLGRPVAARWE